jgi:azurin
MSNSPTTRRTILMSLGGLVVFAATGARAATPTKEAMLMIESDGDFPFFVPDELTVLTGAKVTLTFHHTGQIMTQSHNWVLVRPGTMEAVENAGIQSGEKSNWLKKDDPNVLVATPLIGKGAHVTFEFIAPAPGDYPFMCTTPGHGEDMHGILHVTPN